MPLWKDTKNKTANPELINIEADSKRELDSLKQFLKQTFKNKSMTPAMIKALKADFDDLKRKLRLLEEQANQLVLNKKIPEKDQEADLNQRRIAQAQLRKELIENTFAKLRLGIQNFLPETKVTISQAASQGTIQRKRRGPASIAAIGDDKPKSRFKKSSNDPIENEFRQNQEESESLLELLNPYRDQSFPASEISPVAKRLKNQVNSYFDDLDKRLSSYETELTELAKEADNLPSETKTPLADEQKKDLAERRRKLSKQKKDLIQLQFNEIGFNIERLHQIQERYFPEVRDLTTFRDTKESIQQESIQTLSRLEKEFDNYKSELQESGLTDEPKVSSAMAKCEKLLDEMSQTYQNYLELVENTGHRTISSEDYAKMMLAKDQMDDLEKIYDIQKQHLNDVTTVTKMQKKMAVMQRVFQQVIAIKQNFSSNPLLQDLHSLLSDPNDRLNISMSEEEINRSYSELQTIINDAYTKAEANLDNEFSGHEKVLSGIGAISFNAANRAIKARNLLSEPFELTDNPDKETAERLSGYLTHLVTVNEFDRLPKARQSLEEIRAQFNKQVPDIKLSHENGNSSFKYNNKAHNYDPKSSFGEAVNAYAVARQTIYSALENGDQPNVNYAEKFSDLIEAQAALNRHIEIANWQARIAEVKAAEAAKAAEEAKAAELEKTEVEQVVDNIVHAINEEIQRIEHKHKHEHKHGKDDPRIDKLQEIREEILKLKNPKNTNLSVNDIRKNIRSALSDDKLKDLTFSKQNSLVRFVTQKILMPLANLFTKKPGLFANKTEKKLRDLRDNVQEQTSTPTKGR